MDTEQILGLLAAGGYPILGNPAEAEVLIVNTCGFIDAAKQEAIDTLLEMAAYKKTGRLKALVAAGCLVQRYGEALREQMPEVDAFLGVGEYERLPEILEKALTGERPLARAQDGRVFEGERVLTTPPHSAYLRLGDGCDNRCAYCAIPLIRGPYRSRAYDAVLAEARTLTRKGVTELTLIAQDTTRFGEDLPGGKRLPDLIGDLCRLPGARWVRALYCYPSRVDERLLDVLASEEKACAYLDLPLQHIDAAVLTAMNRQGAPERIRALLKAARARGITLRTTLIVGFPGETDAAFERLRDFVEEIRFERLGVFTFSAEEDTPAATMPGQVPEETARARRDTLMRLQQRISLENNRKRVGETCEALVDGARGKWLIARSRAEAPEGDGVLRLRATRAVRAGEYVTCRITGAAPYDLTGEVL